MKVLFSKISSPVFRVTLVRSFSGKRYYHRSDVREYFHQSDKRGGYPVVYDDPPPEQKLSIFGQIRSGYEIFLRESKLWMKEKMAYREKIWDHGHNEDIIFFRFTDDPMCLKNWVVTCDSDYQQGFSKAKLKLSSQGTGIFSGIVDTTVPEDGRTRRAGLCNVATIPKRKSFMRQVNHDWSDYNYLSLRVRGDGRMYLINLSCQDFYDLSWNDVYSYVLHTRGGPYWQYTKIPFSKFVFTSRGRIQDRRLPFPTNRITHLNISADSKVDGPFKLEIDYVSLGVDYLEWEESAYEAYRVKLIQ